MNQNNNYFSLYGLPVSYDIDLSDLKTRYRELQKKLHPDNYASSSGSERSFSVQQTALVNDAYSTLKNPLLRAKYLLEINGVHLNDETNTIMDPEFLMQQMEMRESLESVKSIDDLDIISDKLDDQSIIIKKNLSNLFSQENVNFENIATEVRKFQFFSRLQEEVENLYAKYEDQ